MKLSEGILTAIITTLIIAAILVGVIWFSSHNKERGDLGMEQSGKKQGQTREPAVAGSFYPADAKELTDKIDGFFAQAETVNYDGPVLGLVVPHAGYVYSGQVAAWGFKQVEEADIDTVILIGNSHQSYFPGAAIWAEGAWKTPLGEVAVDVDLAQKIISENKIIKADMAPHEAEHSLEVEVPFLQRALTNFKIVPILMGNGGSEDVEILSQAISKNIVGRKVLVVASSDMSHYPSYEQANWADKKTYEAILTGSVEKLEQAISGLERENINNAQTFLCGRDAVEVLMLVMEDAGAKDIRLLKYANSGDAAGDQDRVVGYSAIAFYGERTKGELAKSEQEKLLALARQTVESYILTGKTPIFNESAPALNRKLGTFVTIKKYGQLRGCIGNFTPLGAELDSDLPPLWQNVAQMAIAAAVKDPRFQPVSADELKDLEYEISVLSPLERLNDWRQIQLGKHGVEIKKGKNSGVFLPQVATETGWDLDAFMGQLCSQKAGLSWDCWKDKDTEIYVFTAQVF